MENRTKAIIPERPLLVLPTLAKEIGLNESIILQQMHYWLLDSKHFYDERKWIYNSYPEWQKQFPFWSIDTIKRTIRKLEDKKYIISSNYNKMKMDKTKWYSIEYDNIPEVTVNANKPAAQNPPTIGADCPDQEGRKHRPIPETTPETTPKKKKKDIQKSSFAEEVLLSDVQHQKLLLRTDKRTVTKAIEMLSNYKCSSGHKYKSDYHAILTWAEDKAKKEVKVERDADPFAGKRK